MNSDNFLSFKNDELFLKTCASKIYSNKVKDGMSFLFANPVETEKYISDFDEIQEDSDCMSLLGGAAKKKETKKSELVMEKKKFSIMPSYINVIKGKIFYDQKSKLQLKKLKRVESSGDVILGTVIDYYKLHSVLEKKDDDRNLTKNDVKNYVNKYDTIPLSFNFNTKDIVFRNRKENFFSKESRLIFITFKVKEKNMKYFYESQTETPLDNFVDISKVTKDPFIVAHYIFDNYHMLVNDPLINLTLYEIYDIDFDSSKPLVLLTSEKHTMKTNNRKITLHEFSNVLKQFCVPKLSAFKIDE